MLLRTCCLCLGAIALPATPAVAQDVFFDVSPLGQPVNTTPGAPSAVVQVQPGATVFYELGVTVRPSPADPNLQGLGAFDVNILTDLGLTQPPLTSFDGIIQQSFLLGTSLGTPSGSDILNISATQDITGITNSGVGVGGRQVLGTGQLITPATQGEFTVSVTGTAQRLAAGVNPFSPVLAAATVGATSPLVIQTRTPTTNPSDNTNTNNPAADFGTSLVNLCFPAAASVTLICMAGLVGLRLSFRRRSLRSRRS